MTFKMSGWSAFTKADDKSKLHANLSDKDKKRIRDEARNKAEAAQDAAQHYRNSGDFSENPDDKNIKTKMVRLDSEATRHSNIAKNLAKKYNIPTNVIKENRGNQKWENADEVD